jgi:hypothetical protein
MAPDTARAGVQSLWAAMVELAEAGNDIVVQTQRGAQAEQAQIIASIAADLAALAMAAATMARHAVGPTP